MGYWRDGFLSLPDLLCWPLMESTLPPAPPPPDATEFLFASSLVPANYAGAAFHPDLIAERLNAARQEAVDKDTAEDAEPIARPGQGIPDKIRRAIDGKVTKEDRRCLKRPRVVFSTPLTREDPRFGLARERARRPRRRQT